MNDHVVISKVENGWELDWEIHGGGENNTMPMVTVFEPKTPDRGDRIEAFVELVTRLLLIYELGYDARRPANICIEVVKEEE